MTMIKIVDNLVSDELDKPAYEMYKKSLLGSKYLIANVFNKNNSAWSDNINTKEKETFHQMVVESFKDAVKELSEKYGDIAQIEWGKIHQLRLKHPLGKVKLINRFFNLNRNFAAPGNANTVNPFTYSNDKAFDADMGASEKHIFNTANWDQSYSILPTGISGNPASIYYCDQTTDYMQGKVYKDIFSLENIKKQAKLIAVFKPE